MRYYQYLSRLRSGGQTGVDWSVHPLLSRLRQFDTNCTLDYTGYIPKSRRTESGVIPDEYINYIICPSDRYPVRTSLNITTSDATVILTPSPYAFSPGTQLTYNLLLRGNKPHLVVKLSMDSSGDETDIAELGKLIFDRKVRDLNVAGPRESKYFGICERAADWLFRALTREM